MRSLPHPRLTGRRLIAGATIACAVGLAVVTPGATAATTAAPRLGAPAASSVATDHGRRVVMTIPVTYDLRRLGNEALRARLHTVVRVQLRLGGRTVTALARRRLHGASLAHLDYHPSFTAGASAAVQRALDARSPRAERPRLTVEARDMLDSDGDGKVDSSNATTRTTSLPRPSTLNASGGLSTEDVSDDPCGYFGVAQPCQDVSDSQWEAEGFWYSHGWNIDCPSGDEPAVSWQTNYPAATVQTNSTEFNFEAEPLVTSENIIITDDNLHDHPWGYTPWVACVPRS